MDPLAFFATVALISASGALSPGPLTFATVSSATRYGSRAGIEAALGHMVVELPIAYLVFTGTLVLTKFVGTALGVLGGLALIAYGIMGLKGDGNRSPPKLYRGFYVGLLFTALNPYFIMWWLTIGASLSLLALESMGPGSFPVMYISHVWLDVAWLSALALLTAKGASVLTSKYLGYVNAAFSLLLLAFGLLFILNALGYPFNW